MSTQKPRALLPLGTQKGNDKGIRNLGRVWRPNKKTKGWINIIQLVKLNEFMVIKQEDLLAFMKSKIADEELPEFAFEKLYFSNSDIGVDSPYPPEVANYLRRLPNRVTEHVGIATCELSPNLKTHQWVYIARHMGHLGVITNKNFGIFINGGSTLKALAFEGLFFEDTHWPFFQRPKQEKPKRLVQKEMFPEPA
jgi:hypothetical protein